jgi:DNA-binding response OmpR family regulator
MLTSWLKMLCYQVERAYTAEQARIKWREQRPDLVIFDSALPGGDILKMCKELQCEHDALLLVLTEDKGYANEVRCLEAGADDYLHKPFFPDQLLAHMHALTRRVRTSIKVTPTSRIKVGSLSVDPLHNTVSVQGKAVRLTPLEGKMMRLLAANADTVCTTDQIVSHVWGFDGGDSTLIKTHIYHLRRKIERDPDHPHCIHTVPGVGYVLKRQFDEEPPMLHEEKVRNQAS